MIRRIALTLAVGFAVACGSSSSNTSGGGTNGGQFLAGFNPPAPAQGDTQIVGPILHDIPAGGDQTWCSYIANPLKEATDFLGSYGLQSKFGHHALLMDVGNAGTPGDTHLCTDNDMKDARFIGGATDAAQNFQIPDGIAIRVQPGGNLMIQSHWINTGTANVDAQAVFNVMSRPIDMARQPAQTFTALTDQITVQPHATATATTTCPIGQDLQLFLLAGHEHAWGTRVRIELIPPGQSAGNMLYDHAWTPEFTSNPPRLMFSKDAPLVLHKGDQLKVTCDWNNTTGNALTFPTEMCVAFGMYFPATADLFCTDGLWGQ